MIVVRGARRSLRLGRMPLCLTAVLLSLLFAPVPASAQAAISELGWAGSDLSAADEWIEIAPLSATGSVSLSGWTVYSLTGTSTQKILTIGPVTLSGAAIVVSNYAETQSRLLAPPALVTTAVSLPNSALHLELHHPDGTVVDEVLLGSQPAGHTGASGGLWATAERIDPAVSGADPANWRTATISSGFDDGAPMLGSPGSVDWWSPEDSSSASSSSESSSEESSSESSSSSSSEEEILDGAELVLSSSSSFSVASSSSAASSSSSSVTSSSSSLPPDGLIGGFRITEVMADPSGSDDGEWVEVGNLASVPLSVDGVLLQRRGLSRTYRFVEIFGTGATFAPGEHRVVSRERSLITLPNTGGELLLTHGEALVDSFLYPAADEGVSSGRLDDETVLFCTPTPGTRNIQSLPSAGLLIQGGSLSGVGKTSLNVAADIPDLPGDVACRIDFGDGTVSESCNPGSHAFNEPGSYDVQLEVFTVCGDIQADPLTVNVDEEQSSSSSASSSSAKNSSSSSKSQKTSSSSSGAEQRSCPPSAATGVSIAGALPNPAEADEEFEVIVLRNEGSAAADLCGWVLDDGPEGSKPFKLDGQSIAVGGDLRLLRTVTGLALNNDGDVVRLFRPGDPEPVSTVAYEKAREDEYVGPMAVATAHQEEKHDHDQLTEPYQMRKSPPSDGASGATSAAPGEIILSEVMSHPQAGQPEWIELQNLSGRTVDLSGWTLDDDPAGGSTPWLIPHGATVQAGGFIVFKKTETKLSLNDSGDQVELRRGSQLLDSVELPVLKADVAFARQGEDDWCQTSRFTPGAFNVCASVSSLQSKSTKTQNPSSSQQLGLLASLKEAPSQPGMTHDPSGGLGWIAWAGAALLLLGAVVWAWMHVDEWRWKLQQVAE